MKAGPASRGCEEIPVDSGVATIQQDGRLLTLLINGVESSCIDVVDPENLDFEYMQHMTCAVDSTWPRPRPVRALHIGGAACCLPRAWAHMRPGSRQTALEVDAALAKVVRERFDLPRSPELKIRIADGRTALEAMRPQSWDVIVRDAFVDGAVPQLLRTVEAAKAVAAALRPGGLYVLNCAHGGGQDGRVDLASIFEAGPAFGPVVAIADPKVGRGGRRGNIVLVAQRRAVAASGAPLTEIDGDVENAFDIGDLERRLRCLPLPARPMVGADLRRWYAGTKAWWDQPPS